MIFLLSLTVTNFKHIPNNSAEIKNQTIPEFEEKDSIDIPTFIFLDTNAVIDMLHDEMYDNS
jgi:hypothetical protein